MTDAANFRLFVGLRMKTLIGTLNKTIKPTTLNVRAAIAAPRILYNHLMPGSAQLINSHQQLSSLSLALKQTSTIISHYLSTTYICSNELMGALTLFNIIF